MWLVHVSYILPGISGHVQYSNVPAGSYVLLIQATSIHRERATVRRIVHIGEFRKLVYT